VWVLERVFGHVLRVCRSWLDGFCCDTQNTAFGLIGVKLRHGNWAVAIE
jgi:hypothetical protein